MNVKMKFDTRPISKAIRDLRPHVKKSQSQLVEQAAKGFVKHVVGITPPSGKDKKGTAAKQAGELQIKSDLARIMVGVVKKSQRDTRAAVASPSELHRRFRDKRTGRINPGGLKQPYRVNKSELLALQRELIKSVGMLASGWCAAAKRLRVRLPAWISRHGTSHGSVSVTTGMTSFRIVIANSVRFVGSVRGLRRRIQGAINMQANTMKRQAEYLLKKSLRKSGWK